MTNWPLDHFKYVVTSPLRGLPQLNLTDFPHRVTCLILIGIDQTWNLKIRVEPTQPSKWISTFVYNCTDIKNNKPKNQLLSSYVCLPCQQCCSALKADLVLHKRTIYLPFHATSQSAAQITTCLVVFFKLTWYIFFFRETRRPLSLGAKYNQWKGLRIVVVLAYHFGSFDINVYLIPSCCSTCPCS